MICRQETRIVCHIEESNHQNLIVTGGRMVVLNLQGRRWLSLQGKGINKGKQKMRTDEEYAKMAEEYVANVAKYIEDTQGSVPAEYQISLMMLHHNLYYYMRSFDATVDNGIVFEGKDGRQYLAQTWHVLQDTQKRIMDILKQFGLTTMSRSKIKLTDGGMTAEQLLNNLLRD